MSRRFQDFSSPWPVVLGSAGLGSVLGCRFTSTWQVAVETAQISAGLVEYPLDNAFYRYHATAWSLLHQILAVPLRLGMDERTLSIVLSAILLAGTFGGITLCCYSLCRNSAASIGAPLVWYALFRDSNAYGVAYPLFLTGTHHTYGVLGRTAALWLAGLAANRYDRTALLVAGVLPALHLTWGLYAALVVGFACTMSAENIRECLGKWPWLVAGLSISGISFGIHWFLMPAFDAVDEAKAERLLSAFLLHWDNHRVPINMLAPGTWLVFLTTLSTGVLWWRIRGKSGVSERRMFAIVLIAGFGGMAGLLAARYPQYLPVLVSLAIPGRFANFLLILLPAFVLGLLARRGGAIGTALLSAMVAYVCWNWFFDAYLSSDKWGWTLAHWKWVSVFIVAGTAVSLNSSSIALPAPAVVGSWLACVVLAVGVLVLPKGRVQPLWSSVEDSVLVRARAETGLIITGPAMELMQLRTRRPILLNTGALDQLPYVPSSGPDMFEVLKAVYGIDLEDPPEEIRRRRVGGLPEDAAVSLFAERSVAEWQEIARRYGGGGPVSVLVAKSHRLAFDPEIESDVYRLYTIPPSQSEE